MLRMKGRTKFIVSSRVRVKFAEKGSESNLIYKRRDLAAAHLILSLTHRGRVSELETSLFRRTSGGHILVMRL